MKFKIMKFENIIGLFLIFTISNFSPQVVYASELALLNDMSEEYYYFLEEEVVTPTKTPKPIRKAPAIVTVISQQQIKDMGAQTLSNVLETIPGISISIMRYGKFEIEVRGIKTVNSEKVLLMLDGHRVNMPLTGGAPYLFDDMPVDNIEKIEVVRGPGSALYGTGAFLTTINIISQKPEDIDGVRVEGRGGSFDTWGANILFGNRIGEVGISGSIDFLDTNGPQVWVAKDFANLIGQPSQAPDTTNDWLKKKDLSLNLDYKGIYWRNRYVEKNRGDYIGVASNLGNKSEIKLKQGISVLGFKYSLLPELDIKAEASLDQVEFDAFWEAFPPGFLGMFPDGVLGNPQTKNRTLGAEIQVDYEISEQNLLTLGWNLERIKQFDTKHTANFDPNTLAPLSSFQEAPNWNKNVKRNIWALYVQDGWNITDDISLTIGGRYDHYSDFGETFNPRGGLTWQIVQPLGVKLLYGSAFRAPNFEQLYNINNPAQLGNKDLDPEKITTYEIELDYQIMPQLVLRVNYFNNQIKDLIVVAPTTAGELRFENNDGTTKIYGSEVELQYQVKGGYYGYVNYTYLNPKDEHGRRIPDVALHRGNLGLNLPLTKYINSNTKLLVMGNRYRAEGDTRDKLSSHTVVNQSVILKNLLDNFEIQATAFNLFDEDYQDPAPANTITGDYPRPGIHFLLEARYTF